jgi:hypothetical protein
MGNAAIADYFGETLAFRARANAVLAVHAKAPSDEEWLESITAVSTLQAAHELVRVVAVSLTPDAVPSTQQRTLVSTRVQYERVRIALVGGGSAMRMVVRAFSLFYPQTRAFPLDDVDAGLRFVSVPDPSLARRDLDELVKHFGGSLPAAK